MSLFGAVAHMRADPDGDWLAHFAEVDDLGGDAGPLAGADPMLVEGGADDGTTAADAGGASATKGKRATRKRKASALVCEPPVAVELGEDMPAEFSRCDSSSVNTAFASPVMTTVDQFFHRSQAHDRCSECRQ